MRTNSYSPSCSYSYSYSCSGRSSTSTSTSTSTIVLLLLALAGTAAAHTDDEQVLPAAASYKGNDVKVDEHLGAKVPLDAQFHTSDGQAVTLGDVLRGEIPTILTFNYSDCPMLCSLQLNGLTAALPKLAPFVVGGQFRIVTIDLEPAEPLDKLAKMKQRYLARAGGDAAGWTFLQGDAAAIKRVADAVGFSYVYVPERAEWAHPAALIFLSSAGAVTRYVYGIDFEAQMMRESIISAGKAEPSTAVGFMNRCYHYDPDANSHARAGVLALRIGAAGFVVLLLSGFGVLHVVRRARPGVTRS